MTRTIAIVLVCLLALSLAACGGAATPTAQNVELTPTGASTPVAAPTLPPVTVAADDPSAPEATSTPLPIVPMQTALATLISGTMLPEASPAATTTTDVRGTPEPVPTTGYVDDSLGLAVPLTSELLLNSEYTVPAAGGTVVQLVEGVYEDQSNPNAPLTVRALPELIAYGDIGSDGLEEAIVPFATNTGGTGVFIDLVVMSGKSGTAQQTASTSLGDRVLIKAISIEPGRILVTMVTHGPNDPACCPTLEVTVPYTFVNGALSKGEPIPGGTPQ